MGYYQRFISAFPSVQHLAKADEKAVLKLWQGLGYYSRARNLHHAAKAIVDKHGGVFPSKYEDILGLKGIGEYTAAAISSFAFNEPYPVIDGNVYRVLSRYYGIFTPTDTGSGKKEFKKVAASNIDKEIPGLYNQAIMEFGALQCKPLSPDCHHCPLHKTCYAFKNNAISSLPAKSKGVKVRSRYFNYLIINHGPKTYLHKRKERDIWQHLYEPPMIETVSQMTYKQMHNSNDLKKILKNAPFSLDKNPIKFIHQLTHQKIFAQFWSLSLEGEPLTDKGVRFAVYKSEIDEYPMHRLAEKYYEYEGTSL